MSGAANINEVPVVPNFVRFTKDFGQRFLVTIDTEEEFDWNAPFDRHRHTTDATSGLTKFLQLCEGFGIVPVFLIDYPIAISSQAVIVLKQAALSGRAEIGVHMHPWVNPPFEEEVCIVNSFVGNLPAEQERNKLFSLRAEIERNFSISPRIYRAGRYGAGRNTAALLHEGGIAIDSSVRSRFDYRSMGGCDFSNHPLRPYWLDEQAGLVELPLTTVYWGFFRKFGTWLYPQMQRAPLARAVMARLGLLERIPLTPEGTSVGEALRGIEGAIDLGLPVLVFSFHSPSLVPGNTPYVQNQGQLEEFYSWWRQVFAHLSRCNISSTSVSEILTSIEVN